MQEAPAPAVGATHAPGSLAAVKDETGLGQDRGGVSRDLLELPYDEAELLRLRTYYLRDHFPKRPTEGANRSGRLRSSHMEKRCPPRAPTRYKVLATMLSCLDEQVDLEIAEPARGRRQPRKPRRGGRRSLAAGRPVGDLADAVSGGSAATASGLAPGAISLIALGLPGGAVPDSNGMPAAAAADRGGDFGGGGGGIDGGGGGGEGGGCDAVGVARRQLLFALRCLEMFEAAQHKQTRMPAALRWLAAIVTGGSQDDVEEDSDVEVVGDIVDLTLDDDEVIDIEVLLEKAIPLVGGNMLPASAVKADPVDEGGVGL